MYVQTGWTTIRARRSLKPIYGTDWVLPILKIKASARIVFLLSHSKKAQTFVYRAFDSIRHRRGLLLF